ncbi:RusA family crossover junction endodeoxyribonuclease [Pseudoduganella ginsengisoli]
MSLKARKWEETILATPIVRQPLEVSLKLDVLHLHAGGTLRDVDNTAKPVMDAFNGHLYQDDKQIRELVFRSLRPLMGHCS